MDYTNRKERLTRDKICNNVLTMLLTASESIATTMNFVIFMLANYPEIQEKAHKELLEIYGTETVNSAPVKYNDLQNMHYLDRVIKETLRIFPPAPLIARKVMED
ncbi:PREDICTED: cytochrome P450 4V2-like, partial [Wasmannia auropunctata]|uniref:cytochrome P450 4V2-like n=1 Tax=Wasmannia auropunctata TaxID=64793 RepID=UPI0005F04702